MRGACSRPTVASPPGSSASPASRAGTPVDDTWLRVPYEDPALPGWHRSETLDLMVVLEGDLVLGLDDGEHPLGAGAAVVQRGTFHRWRVVGEQPCTFLSVLDLPGSGGGCAGSRRHRSRGCRPAA